MAPKSFICIDCGFEASTFMLANKHTNLVHSKFHCHLCNYKSTERPALLRHLKYQHELTCQRCKKAFSNENLLKNHECDEVALNVTKLDCKTLKCNICGYISLDSQSVYAHVKGKHLKQFKFKCEICDKEFLYKSYLDKHVRMVHNREKRFKCDECGFEFYDQGAMKRHLECHKNKDQMDFKCRIVSCDFVCDNKGALKRHHQQCMAKHEAIKDIEAKLIENM